MGHRTRRAASPSAQCKQAIATLPTSAFGSLDALLDEVGTRRKRELTVETAPALDEGAPSGLWLNTRHRDRIIVSASVSAAHRQHIILHEVGHMMLDHTPRCGADDASVSGAQPLITTLSAELINFVLNRRDYENEDEAQAELFATLAGVKLLRPVDVNSHGATVIYRLADSLHSW